MLCLWNLCIARLGCLLTRSSIVQFHPGELLSNVYILTTPSAASLLYTSSISTYPTRKILMIIVISTYVLYLFYHYQISSRQIKQCVIEKQILISEATKRIISKAILIVSVSLLLVRFALPKTSKLFYFSNSKFLKKA